MSNQKRRLKRVNRQQLLGIGFVLLVVAALFYLFQDVGDYRQLHFVRPDQTTTTSFKAQLVSTPQARERGLMFVREMPARQGMLFIFPKEEKQSFWMKNTYIPLDMIFINSENKVVGVVENARPFTTKQRFVDQPSRYVLELNAGEVKQHSIVVGAELKLTGEMPDVVR